MVIMEPASECGKQFYYLMEDQLPVMLVNAKRARNIPGRKTVVNGTIWLVQLTDNNLLHSSFIPPVPIRQLRDLTRTRTAMIHDRTKVYQWIETIIDSSKD